MPVELIFRSDSKNHTQACDTAIQQVDHANYTASGIVMVVFFAVSAFHSFLSDLGHQRNGGYTMTQRIQSTKNEEIVHNLSYRNQFSRNKTPENQLLNPNAHFPINFYCLILQWSSANTTDMID
jgi:hypothetical protein